MDFVIILYEGGSRYVNATPPTPLTEIHSNFHRISLIYHHFAQKWIIGIFTESHLHPNLFQIMIIHIFCTIPLIRHRLCLYTHMEAGVLFGELTAHGIL